MCFFEKKNRKTLASWPSLQHFRDPPQKDKGFLALFPKKEQNVFL
jgi:hypothetical protein